MTPSSDRLVTVLVCEARHRWGTKQFLTFASAQGLEADLRDKYDESISYNDVMSAAMYPKVFDEYRRGTLRLCRSSRHGIALLD